MKNWLNKPMTWGSYLKFGAICSLIGIAISAATMIITFTNVIDNFKTWIDESMNYVRMRRF